MGMKKQAFICKHGQVIVDGLCAACGEPMTQAKEWNAQKLKEFDEKLRWFMAGEGTPNDLKSFISSTLAEARKETIEKVFITLEGNIGMLRQWLNEDRITDPNKMVSSADIKRWLLSDILSVIKEKGKV